MKNNTKTASGITSVQERLSKGFHLESFGSSVPLPLLAL